MEFTNLINTYLTQHFVTNIEGFKHNTSAYLDLTICRELAYVFHIPMEEAINSFCDWCEEFGYDYQFIISN